MRCFTVSVDSLLSGEGVAIFAPILELQPENLDFTFAVNCRAPFILTQCLAEQVLRSSPTLNVLDSTVGR